MLPMLMHASPIIIPPEKLAEEDSLLESVKNNDLQKATAILKKGVNPNVDSRHKELPALTIAASNGNADLVKMLINYGAFVDVRDKVGMGGLTPLIAAAKEGHGEIVKILLKEGASPNIGHAYGGTALMMAAEKGYDEVVHELLFGNADPELGFSCGAGYCGVWSNSGKTALIYAIENKHPSIVKQFIGSYANDETIQNLIDGKYTEAKQWAKQKKSDHLLSIIEKIEEYENRSK